MRLATISCAFVAAACVSPLAQLKSETPVGRFVIRSDGLQGDRLTVVAESLEKVPAALSTWGTLEPVTIYVLPDHQALEAAAHRTGYSWLRAWAHLDDVLLQAPHTWTTHQLDVDDLLLHELTHCLMFQRVAPAGDRRTRDVPLWFREGMAVWTAKQSGTLPSLEDLARWLVAEPHRDVFVDGEALARDAFAQVYGLSFHAFEFLVRRHGVGQINALLNAMKSGQSFAEAFASTFAVTPRQFWNDFEHWVKWRGFRGSGRAVGDDRSPPP
jgi:hypothetical protein